MAWKTVEVHPTPQNPSPAVSAISSSPPLMRICGSLGFLGVGVLVLYVTGFLLGLPPGFWDAGKWGFRETFAIGISCLASMVGGLLGAGIGLQLRVTSAEVNRLLAILWHFVANGQIVCVGLLGFALSRKRNVATMSESLRAFGLAVGACALIAIVLFLLRQFRDGHRPSFLICFLVTAPVTVALAFHQAKIFQLDRATAVVLGMALGLALILLSAYTIQRDYDQLAQIRQSQRRD